MRIGAIVANAVALLFCFALCTTFVRLLGRVGSIGTLVAGLMALWISYNVELKSRQAAFARFKVHLRTGWNPHLSRRVATTNKSRRGIPF